MEDEAAPRRGPSTDTRKFQREKHDAGVAALQNFDIPVERKNNPLILPTDKDWMQVEDFFRKILREPHVSMGIILSRYFNEHDQCLFLPVVSPPSQVTVQKDRTEHYRVLLAGRLRGHVVTLATKFTMLYFGLPVEPAMSALFNPSRHIVEETDDSGLQDVEVQPPLHFLTAHDQRNFGIDARRGRKAAFSTVPVLSSDLSDTAAGEPVLGLRGGALDDEDDLFGDQPTEDAQPDVTMGGTEPVASDVGLRTQYNPILLGYQGRCEISFQDYGDAFDAIRCLLSASPSETTDLVVHKIELSTITSTWTFPDPKSAYKDAMICFLENTKTSNPEFFIHRIGEEPPEPDRFVPRPYEDNVFKFHCSVNHRTFREGYLRLPPEELFWSTQQSQQFGANDYMAFVENVFAVIHSRPRFTGDGLHSMIHLEGFTHGSDEMVVRSTEPPTADQLTTWRSSYGGFELDKRFLDFAHQANENAPISTQVYQRDLTDQQIALVIPGAKTPELIIDTPINQEQGLGVLKIVRDFFAGEGLEYLQIYRGTEFYYPPESGSVAPFRWYPDEASDSTPSRPSDTDVLQHLYTSVQESRDRYRYFVLQPFYRTPSVIREVGGVLGGKPIDTALESITAFRKMVFDQHGPVGFNKVHVVIQQLGDGPKWNLVNYVVKPDTTSEELARIRRLISVRFVQFRVTDQDLDSTDFVNALASSSQTVFGPRYGLIDPYRKRMGLRPLLQPDDPKILQLRVEWSAKKEAAAAADAREAARRSEPPRSPGDGASRHAKPKPKRSLFSNHLTGNMREKSWSRPQSLYDGNGSFHPYIPINSAPVESMLRVSDGSSNSVPIVSRGVLSPSEQRHLQEEVHTLRNLTLKRIQICQFEGCKFQCRSDDTHALQEHQKTHIKYRCPWCPDLLFEHCHPKSRENHFKEKHADQIKRLAGEVFGAEGAENNPLATLQKGYQVQQQPRDPREELHTEYSKSHPRPPATAPRMTAPSRAHPYEREYSNCDRCGRSHDVLNNKSDREHHDAICVPHAEGAGDCGFCKTCGVREWKSQEDAEKWDAGTAFPHRCRGLSHPDQPYCEKCGFSLNKLSNEYIDGHREFCMGYGSMLASFCPYCKVPLNNIDPDQANPEAWLEHKQMHITSCRRSTRPKPRRATPGDMTPFDLYHERYWRGPEPPHDDLWHGPREPPKNLSKSFVPAKYLTPDLEWFEREGEKQVQDPPDMCPVAECGFSTVGLRPHDLLEHFEKTHGGVQKTCPLCSLSFKVPSEHMKEGGDRYEREYQVRHMECHVFQLWDILANKKQKPMGNPMPLNHPLCNPSDEGLERHQKRCPYFEECGAMVGYMSDAQWENHMKMHGKAPSETAGTTVTPELLVDIEDRIRKQIEELRERDKKQKATSQGTAEPPQPPTSQPPAPKPLTSKLQTPKPPTKISTSKPSTSNTSTSKTSSSKTPTSKPSTGKTPDQDPKKGPSLDGRTSTTKLQLKSRPRAPMKSDLETTSDSPDSSDSDSSAGSDIMELVIPDDIFIPRGDYYCSRCFRKAPQRARKGEPPVKEQIAAHLSDKRSCCIDNGVGTAFDVNGRSLLPSSSGWIRKDALPASWDWTIARQGWVQEYPEYTATMYPYDGKGSQHTTEWKYDPNHPANVETWSFEFPPPNYVYRPGRGGDARGAQITGSATGEGSKTKSASSAGPSGDNGGDKGDESSEDVVANAPSTNKSSTKKRGKKGWKGRGPNDPLYRHKAGDDAESTDEEANTQVPPQEQQELKEVEASMSSGGTKRKRKTPKTQARVLLLDPTQVEAEHGRGIEGGDEEEERSPKRTKTESDSDSDSSE